MTRSPSPAKPSSARCCCSLGLVTALLLVLAAQQCSAAYYGKLIGKLSQYHHGVSGEVYAVDARTLFIKDFTYDGEGPAAYFFAGSSKNIGQNGFRIRDERGTTNLLKRYRKKDITLTLPEGKTLNNIKWFSVWCEEFAVNFGDVKIPRSFDYPRPQKLASLSGIHGVSSEPVVVVDAQTLLIPGFSYDGEAPDAKFWVGTSPSPSPQGIRVPDENGKEKPLRRYDRKTIVLTLPGDLTVHQLGHFGVWCEAFAVDFGHVQIPQNLNVPPSLKMLGVSPQSKLNCEVLEDGLAFEVRWAVAGDSIVVQLVGKLDGNQYMSFGLSAEPKRSQMIGGDVVVAWVDKQTLQGYAVDYFLDAKSQCSGGRGSCPDTKIQENTNSIRLLNAAMVNGYSIVTYQRPLKASDELDRQIFTNGSQAIIWAIGPLNDKNEVSFHSSYLKGDRFIEFGRPPAWNCPMPELQDQSKQQQQQHPQQIDNSSHHRDQKSSNLITATTRRPQRIQATPAPAPKTDAWEIPPIQCYEPEDGVFYAQMGPTGGKHGYPAITGHVGWGISWYINGLLIPEIHVVRGKTYTFVVEGGENSETPARYHPFYITDDPVGGYQHKTPEERANVTIFAGVRNQRGVVRPTGVGRLCNWVPDQQGPEADEFSSFGAYQRTLTLVCDNGEPGIVTWKPDANTPDTVYYQCFTHRYLGWKIHVHDSCDSNQGSASEQDEVLVDPNADGSYQPMDLETGASIRANPSKVTPSPEFFQHHQEYTSQDYDYLRNQANHPQLHHQNHHHPQTATNNPGKLITDHHQIVRRPAAVLMNQVVQGTPMRVSYSIPVHQPTTTSHNIIYTRTQTQNVRMQPPQPPPQQSPPPPSQMMFVQRRPQPPSSSSYYQTAVRRPPPSLTSSSMGVGYHQQQLTGSLMTVSRPPVFYERKKAVYKGPMLSRMHTLGKQNYHQHHYHQPTKLMKLDMKHQQRAIIEAKLAQSESKTSESKASLLRPMMMKPARNTGFDPGSIVIEKGFKPILNKRNSNAEKAMNLDRSSEMMLQDEEIRETTTEKYNDSFEPVFIPSPPDRNGVKKQSKKKVQLHRTKLKLDNLDDMEMAAADRERLDYTYLYLPTAASAASLSKRSPKSNYPSLSGPSSNPTSSLESQIEQSDDETSTSAEEKSSENPESEINSRHTLDKRTKRFAQQMKSENWDATYNRNRDPDNHQDHSHHDHNHDHSGHDDHTQHQHEEKDSHQSSTGETILSNIKYVFLTIVLYYAL